jgi:hypothetical protein
LVGFEAQERGSGPLGGVGDDQAVVGEDPGDGGSGDRGGVVVGQVPADRLGADVQALAGELFAELTDRFDGLVWDGGGRGVRASGAGLERGLALEPVAGQ